jgi:hypothetical protein
MTEPLPASFQISTLIRITEQAPAPVLQPATKWVIRGDEELLEWNFESRTSPRNETATINYKCTPSVFRFYPQPREGSGDFRVNITPMRSALLTLNGGDERKLEYLFNPGTALYNSTGYPKQAYVTMSRNEVKVIGRLGEWLKIATLTPTANVSHMTYTSYPEYVHRFDLVCWDRIDETTYHHYNTPRGHILYYLVTNEGFAWINQRYVKELER